MHVLHVFDGAADWEQRVAAEQLLTRLDADRFQQSIASVDSRVPASDWFADTVVARHPIRFGLALTAAPALRKLVEERGVRIVHAWGTQAAVASVAALPKGCALVIERFDPFLTPTEAKTLRAIASHRHTAIACSAATVSRRLIERGVPEPVCVVIRPGVDFKRINAVKRGGAVRRGLGIAPDDHLTVTAHPIGGRSGHRYVVCGGYIQGYVNPKRRMALYGDGPEYRQLHRLAQMLPSRDSLLWADSNVRYEELVAAADALVITPLDDASTTPIAWAMAASVPVVGTAVYAVAELIGHKHNGYLILPKREQAMSTRIAAALTHAGEMTKEREVARGQAFEVFSVRRFADQHMQLYENLAAGRTAGHGISDTAVET